MIAVSQSSFTHRGLTIAYTEYGSGPRVLVLTHGLLMDQRMFARVAPDIAERGYRVITVDLPGHGSSEQPYEMTAYSMTAYGGDLLALLDHLGVEKAVIGGTSLGANVALELADAAPHRVRALVLEMPVLEKGITAAAAFFVPLGIALRLSQRGMRFVARMTQKIPRTFFLVDLFIDFARRDPASSLAVLDGLTFGRIAPPLERRKGLKQPTMVIGHPRDPIHPFDDADRTARELPNARLVTAQSIAEWRMRPQRLNAELASFLDEVWRPPAKATA